MKRAALSILLACSSHEPTPEPTVAAPRDAAVRPPDAPDHPVKKLLREAAFADLLVIGPGLWGQLLLTERRMKRDAIGKLGTPSIVGIPGPELLKLDARTFFDAAARDALLATESFRGLLTTFTSVPVRNPTADERKRLYVLVPFETDKDVVVFELGKRSLIVVVEKDKILWMDALGSYCDNFTVCPR